MIRIIVRGSPAPQGSKRHVGKGVMIESSKAVKPWRMCVWAAAVALKVRPLQGPLAMSIVFTLPKPKRAPKSQLWPHTRPDLSKLVRSTEDALTDAGIYADDAQIVRFLDVRKVYPGTCPMALDTPGAWIEIFPMEGHK